MINRKIFCKSGQQFVLSDNWMRVIANDASSSSVG